MYTQINKYTNRLRFLRQFDRMLFFLCTERKVRIALHAVVVAQYAPKLHWAEPPMRIAMA